MEYLQYLEDLKEIGFSWKVLNLIINGIPSILGMTMSREELDTLSFKPYYKWNTFNTKVLYFLHHASLKF